MTTPARMVMREANDQATKRVANEETKKGVRVQVRATLSCPHLGVVRGVGSEGAMRTSARCGWSGQQGDERTRLGGKVPALIIRIARRGVHAAGSLHAAVSPGGSRGGPLSSPPVSATASSHGPAPGRTCSRNSRTAPASASTAASRGPWPRDARAGRRSRDDRPLAPWRSTRGRSPPRRRADAGPTTPVRSRAWSRARDSARVAVSATGRHRASGSRARARTPSGLA